MKDNSNFITAVGSQHPYINLANGIIAQAVTDYANAYEWLLAHHKSKNAMSEIKKIKEFFAYVSLKPIYVEKIELKTENRLAKKLAQKMPMRAREIVRAKLKREINRMKRKREKNTND